MMTESYPRGLAGATLPAPQIERLWWTSRTIESALRVLTIDLQTDSEEQLAASALTTIVGRMTAQERSAIRQLAADWLCFWRIRNERQRRLWRLVRELT